MFGTLMARRLLPLNQDLEQPRPAEGSSTSLRREGVLRRSGARPRFLASAREAPRPGSGRAGGTARESERAAATTARIQVGAAG